MAKIPTLQPRIAATAFNRAPVLQQQAGSTKRIRGRAWMEIRGEVLKRDRYTCVRCGMVSIDNEVDHKTRLEIGGSNGQENLQTLCIDCHKAKTSEEAKGRYGPF